MSRNTFSVGEVARIAHVTVRTLHHYDEIGLVVPSERADSGYRIYRGRDLERLHEVLLYRELGLPLEEIRRIVDGAEERRMAALVEHRARLESRGARIRALLQALDARIETLRKGRHMSEDAILEEFDRFDPATFESEVEDRWGNTDAYRESTRRTKHYAKAEWAELKAGAEEIEQRWAELLGGGHAANDDEAMDVAEEARLHIDRWFYPCSHAMHVRLSDMYESDPRFSGHYETRKEGLTAFVVGSIRANLARHLRGREGAG